ncbi:coiled-coil domain-containing protein 178 [Peromyscus maniculatus bairdii]|uniref:coiled-coil domain-containing protein 178 n=1 Tax=Peromyscus maniculatus bairdii TaxID=230844 RepID=UPI001C2DF858|nr:coiled-coil domain-containing protein 178 [Peromyscus maniculatus bairdii]
MPENEKDSAHSGRMMDKSNTGKSCLEIKALSDKARAVTIAENVRLQELAVFSSSKKGSPGSKKAGERHYESKTTNTEEVNKGIYFSYPSRRHSCSLVNIPTPCVSKMIAHIEEVESKIQEHLKQFEASFEEWSSTTKDEKEDLDVIASEKTVHPEKATDEKCPELKKKMETLLSEAVYLIKSLETDRAEAEQALKQQKSRKKRISMKIDSWSIWKLQELPTAVQKEHEMFSKDLEELHSHLEETTQEVEHLEQQKEKLEEANAKIQKDIDYMTHHAPLLEMKRKQELEALKDRYHKKFEVMELFRSVHDELKDSIELCETTKSQLKHMREEDEKDIIQEETNIETYKKELDQLSSLQAHYSTSIESVNVHIEEDEETMTEMLRETQSSTYEVSNLLKNVDDLKKLFDQYSWRQRKLEREYMDALNHYYSSKRTWDIELSDVSKDLTDVSTSYMALAEENKRLHSEIESIIEETGDSIKKKADYEVEIQSLLELKIKNNNYLRQLYKQAYQIGAVYYVARHKTEDLENQIAEVRRKFKTREEFLRRLTRGEMAAGVAIQKRLYTIEETQFMEMQEFLRRKALYTLALTEVELPLRKIEADAVKIRLIHRQHSNMLHEIREKQELVRKKVAATKKKLQRKSKKSRKELTKTEGKGSIIHQEIEFTRNKTIILHAKSIELTREIKIMKLEKINFEDKLEKLKDEFIKLRFDKEHSQGVFDHLKLEKQHCEERIFEEDKMFRKLVEMRQSTLAEIRKLQEDSLAENLRLAMEYQAMQTLFLKEKDTYFNGYDRLLSLNASLCDKKKLCQLQDKLDKQWQEYFRLVILFNQNRLEKFQGDSQDSIQKILQVQAESSSLMQHILDFFQTLTDGSCGKDG